MEFKDEIRGSCRELLEHIVKRKVTDDAVNAAILQLRSSTVDFVTEHEVKISIAGLSRKFVAHAAYQKGRQFTTLTSKYIKLTHPNGLTHPTWSLLHLLFRLAYRPTHPASSCSLEECSSEDPSRAGEIIRKGVGTCASPHPEEPWYHPQLPPPEDWSDSEDDGAACCVRPCVEAPQTTKPIGSLGKLSVNPSKRCSIEPHSSGRVMKNNWDNQMVQWTEHQFMHEIIWALQCRDGASLLFRLAQPETIVRLVGLPSLCLSAHLTALRPLYDNLVLLNNSIDRVKSSVHTVLHSQSHQAYAAALNDVVSRFFQTLADFERKLGDTRSTITTNHLQTILKPWKTVIPALAGINSRVDQMSPTCSNHIKTAELLSVLLQSAQEAHVRSYSLLYPVILRLLSSSLEPFLDMVDRWLSFGTMVDPFNEFGIYRNEHISPRDERFWYNALAVRPGITAIGLFPSLMENILLGGRSVELLNHLGHLHSLTDQRVESRAPSLNQAFRRRFSLNELPHATEQANVLNATSVPCTRPPNQHSIDNPLLKKTFFCRRSSKNPTLSILTNSNDGTEKPPECYPLLPLIEDSLLDPIRRRQQAVSHTLLHVLYEMCNFRSHLLAVRSIYLMQAGDLMARFYLPLFQKIDSGDKWDNEPSLTLSLINCLSPGIGHSATCVSVGVVRNSNVLDAVHLQINYTVPFPLNVIFNQESISLYNEMFRFLLKIKHALTSLQRLSFRDLNDATPQTGEEMKTFSVTNRQHRLQLLRAWLLHFVSSLDQYLMECVLESAHSRLDASLSEVAHFGSVADVHQQYVHSIYSQCLQRPSATFLRDAIQEVLSISLMVCEAWNRTPALDEHFELQRIEELEEKYIQNHQFVASILMTDAAYSMLPQVESLAVALTRSCPTKPSEP